MARPTLFTHRKFARLAADIGSEAAALGHLEFIWAAAGQSGDDLLGDARDVELAARWRGEPGVLLAALMTAGGAAGAGFIEERGGLYYVHDLFDHAPKFVAKRAEREAARVASGRTISEIRSEAGKLGGRPRKNQTEPNENQMDDGSFPEESKTKAKVSTPSPALARALTHNTEERSSCPTAAPSDAIARPVNGHAKVYPADFMAFYAPYPRHEAKDDALKAWKATAGARPPIEEIVAAIEAQKKSDNWRKEGGKFIPLPATWLRAGRWADSLGIEGVQLLPLERPRQAPSFPEGRHYAKIYDDPPELAPDTSSAVGRGEFESRPRPGDLAEPKRWKWDLAMERFTEEQRETWIKSLGVEWNGRGVRLYAPTDRIVEHVKAEIVPLLSAYLDEKILVERW